MRFEKSRQIETMHEYLTLRQERISDFPEIFDVNCLAFEQDGEAKLVDALRKNEYAFVPELSIVAILHDQVVGHIMFTKIRIIEGDAVYESLALAPMAISPEHQNHGIGSKLIEYALRKAQTLGYPSVIVLGHEHYYPKFGFVPTTKWNIRPPFDIPPGAFMGLELVDGAFDGITGVVQYPEEFDEL